MGVLKNFYLLLFAYFFATFRTPRAGDLSPGPHLFSFRTQKLSPAEAMVLERGE